jgi:hypothetical protein
MQKRSVPEKGARAEMKKKKERQIEEEGETGKITCSGGGCGGGDERWLNTGFLPLFRKKHLDWPPIAMVGYHEFGGIRVYIVVQHRDMYDGHS